MSVYLYEVQVSVVEPGASHGVVLGRLVEAQVYQQLAALQGRAHLGLVCLTEPTSIHSFNNNIMSVLLKPYIEFNRPMKLCSSD